MRNEQEAVEAIMDEVREKTAALAKTLFDHMRETTEEGVGIWLTEMTSLTTDVIDGGYRDLILAGVYRTVGENLSALGDSHMMQAVTKLS